MIKVDTCGRLCPQPLIMAKKAIKAAKEGDQIMLISDNDIAFANLQDYLKELKFEFTSSWEDKQGTITFCIGESTEAVTSTVDTVNAEDFCTVPTQLSSYVVVIKSQTMGCGDDDLGAILMRAFVNSLPEADKLPSSIIMYNAGVKLALKGADTVAAFEQLIAKGVKVYACGTCLDFFDLKEELALGTITNMYKITELTTKASHVVYP